MRGRLRVRRQRLGQRWWRASRRTSGLNSRDRVAREGDRSSVWICTAVRRGVGDSVARNAVHDGSRAACTTGAGDSDRREPCRCAGKAGSRAYRCAHRRSSFRRQSNGCCAPRSAGARDRVGSSNAPPGSRAGRRPRSRMRGTCARTAADASSGCRASTGWSHARHTGDDGFTFPVHDPRSYSTRATCAVSRSTAT